MSRVVIIEDQTVIADLIVEILKDNPSFEVLGATDNGQEGYALCLSKKPDMVITDLRLPGLNGIDLIYKLKHDIPHLKILAFSGIFDAGTVKRAVEAGILGFVEKTAALKDLQKGIEMVASGQSFFGPKVTSIMRELMLNPVPSDGLAGLTVREREILQLIAESNSTKEIAARLNISVRTADNHRTNIMRKLDVHDVAALTRFAISHGLVESTPTFA